MASRAAGLLAALLALGVALPAASADARPKPYVFVVVIDGLDGDSVEAGQAPFISSLLAGQGGRGAYFPRSSAVMPAETNPNHTAMVTGADPGKSGIFSNAFALYAPLENEDSCRQIGPVDLTRAPTTTSGESPTCPQAETLFEAVRRQRGRRHPTTAIVMGKPKLGRIFDVKRKGRRAADYLWAPCDDLPEDDSYCGDVPTNPATGYALTDQIVMDEVVRTVSEGVPRRGRTMRPRFTFTSLPQVDSAGHAFGRGLPYDAAAGLADDEVERLVETLQEEGIWRRSVVIVTSDHSMDTALQKINLTLAFQGAGVESSDFHIVQPTGGSIDLIYLANRHAPSGQRNRLLKRMRSVALATPGVAEALYRRPNPEDGGSRHTIGGAHPAWTSGRRTGDIMVTSQPGWGFAEPSQPVNLVPGAHGSPQTADNFMAVVGGWGRIRNATVAGRGRRAHPDNADIAPTVARLLRLRPPRESTGRALKAAFKRGTLRRR
jgi:hypothetical protein